MKLTDLTIKQRKRVAKLAKTSDATLRNLQHGRRAASAEFAIRVEKAAKRAGIDLPRRVCAWRVGLASWLGRRGRQHDHPTTAPAERIEALVCANWIEGSACGGSNWNKMAARTAAELRRLHAVEASRAVRAERADEIEHLLAAFESQVRDHERTNHALPRPT